MVLIKIGLVFTLIVLLLRLKTPFIAAILLAGLVLGWGFNLGFMDIGRAAWVTLWEPETVSLSLIVGIILVLSELLQASGQMTELGRVIIRAFGLHRWTYTILPAIIGLLPMPGGALFTAPMMDQVSNENIPAHKKTLINYWFRHIWEYAWPLYPGLVLAAGLAGVNLNLLSIIQSPLTVISALIGAAFILPGISISGAQPHRYSFIEFIRMAYLISPILIIIILFVAFQLNMLICISAGLGLAIFNVLAGRKLKIAEVLKVIFAKRSVYQMIFVVICVLVFTGIMRASSLIGDLSVFFTGGLDVRIPFGYMTATVILLPFIIGLLTGLTVGFVGITFPLIFSSIVPAGSEIMPLAILAYISGVSGVMLSPVHLCLVLTNQYYNSEFSRVYKILAPVSLLVMAVAVGGFLAYSLL